MDIARHISDQCIELDLQIYLEDIEDEHPNKTLWRGKEAILKEMVNLLEASGNIKNPSRLYNDIFNREKKATTALGEGFAIPHVRTMEARELTFALARSEEGLDFEALDEEPVHIFLAMVAPPHDDNLYLRIYKQIAKGISEGLMDALMSAEHKGDIFRAFKNFG